MNLRRIWNEKLPSLFVATSPLGCRRRVLGALESLEARVNLSAILVVETTNAYWVIEDSTYGAVAGHADKISDDENAGVGNLDVLPYASTDLLVSPNGELAHAEKSTQLENADDNDATPNDSSRSLAQAGGSSLIIGDTSVNHTDIPSVKSGTDTAETNTLLNRLLADTGITHSEVVSLRLLPNVSLEDLVESENDFGNTTSERPGLNHANADSVSSHPLRTTTLAPASGASSTPASAASPSNQPTSKPQETAAASANSVVAWLRTYFQESKTTSAAEPDPSERGNADLIDLGEQTRLVVLNAAFPHVAAVNVVVNNVDQLFAKFQMELADDTGSVTASQYARNVVDADESDDRLDSVSSAGSGVSLSYSQWASLASVVALASGALSNKSLRRSREEDRSSPSCVRTQTKPCIACVTE